MGNVLSTNRWCSESPERIGRLYTVYGHCVMLPVTEDNEALASAASDTEGAVIWLLERLLDGIHSNVDMGACVQVMVSEDLGG